MKLKELIIVFVLCLFALGGCKKKEAVFAPIQTIAPDGIQHQDFGRISIFAMGQRVPVIMYHDVIAVRDSTSVYFDVTAEEFQRQMAWISKNNITPITLDQLYAHLTTGAALPQNAIVLTFDDNYLGFFQNAYPILKQYKYPSAMFVHTNYVGNETGTHPKMGWPELKQLVADGLVTIGGHTESHPLPSPKLPNGFASLTPEQQTKELAGSKSILEKNLGITVNYMAWPDGQFDAKSEEIAKKAGYTMAFAMDHGLAEESPSMYSIHRYEQLKLEEAWSDTQIVESDAPAAVAQTPWKVAPVVLHVGHPSGLKLAYFTGGTPKTLLSDARQGVEDFVSQSGAVAGVNGGLFAMSSLYSKSNVMIGPCLTEDGRPFSNGLNAGLIERLKNRPVIFWGDSSAMITTLQPDSMDDEAVYRQAMPDLKDIFVAGAWIVHDGVGMTNDQMLEFDAKDIIDPRRRVFFGWMADGEPVAGASLETCTTERLAEAAAAAGVKEAVLLDSGFSTSLVYNGRIVVTGHTATNIPSRPVPHAIVFMGNMDLSNYDKTIALAKEGAIDPSDIGNPHAGRRRTRKLRRTHQLRKSTDSPELQPAAPSPDSPPASTTDPGQAVP